MIYDGKLLWNSNGLGWHNKLAQTACNSHAFFFHTLPLMLSLSCIKSSCICYAALFSCLRHKRHAIVMHLFRTLPVMLSLSCIQSTCICHAPLFSCLIPHTPSEAASVVHCNPFQPP